MSGRISIVVALVMVFVAVMLSFSKKSQAQTTPQTPGMYSEQSIEVGRFLGSVHKIRDPEGAVCYVASNSKGVSIACLR